ncbi:MAG: hypothetical protein JEZ06_03580, partial [Anaerolineaceae bacterium]|nr:hypothetical protein [Anaerolineaceae bacterium]
AYLRWLEIEYAKNEAEQLESSDQWAESEKLWRQTYHHHPLDGEVLSRMVRAKTQKFINAAYLLLGSGDQEDADKALTLLQDAQTDQEIGNSYEIRIGLAEIYKVLGNIEHAIDILIKTRSEGETADQIENRINTYKKEKRIQETLNKVEAGISGIVLDERPKESEAIQDSYFKIKTALIILTEAKKDPLIGDVKRIQEKIDDIFYKQKQAILTQVESEIERAPQRGQINALLALMDLQGLEEVIDIPEEARESIGRIRSMDLNIKAVAGQLKKMDTRVDIDQRYSEEALQEYNLIADRLKVFLDTSKLFDYDDKEKICRDFENMHGKILSKIADIKDIVQLLLRTQNETLWENAVKRSDFRELEILKARLQQIESSDLLDVVKFFGKLEEWEILTSYLEKKIADILIDYDEEKYIEVVAVIDALKIKPSRIEQVDLRVMTKEEYLQIHQWMQTKLLVMGDMEGSDLMGWDQVRQDAQNRGGNYQIWEDWLSLSRNLADPIFKKFNLYKHHLNQPLPWDDSQIDSILNDLIDQNNISRTFEVLLPQVIAPGMETYKIVNPEGENYSINIKVNNPLPLILQKWGWEEIYQDSRGILETILKKKPSDAISPNAEEILKQGEAGYDALNKCFEEAKIKIDNLVREIESLSGFPINKELKEIKDMGDTYKLESRLGDAKKIGASNEEEFRWVRIYTNLLEDMKSEPETIIEKILSWFGR